MNRLQALSVATGVLAVLAGLGPTVSRADVINIGPSDDTYIKSNQAATSFGSEEKLIVKSHSTGPQNWRVLLKFDLTGIPAGSTINKATLELNKEVAPGATRNYELHHNATDTWSEGTVTWNTKPANSALDDTVATGTATGLMKWGYDGPNGPGGLNTEALTARVALEFAGNKVISLTIQDSVESNSQGARVTEFTSDETSTANPKPALIVDYTPATACTGPSLDIEAFNHSGPNPVAVGTYACWNIEFKITNGCRALSSVKTQGGIGGNLTVSAIVPSKGSYTTKDLRGGNTVITWNISPQHGGLAPNETQSLTATVCTGTNPRGKQEFTSCGNKPITGAWGAVAVVAEDSSIISSTPGHTDRLEVEADCPNP